MDFIIYTKRVPDSFAGYTNNILFLPISIIRILPECKGDEGLLTHEKTHAKQHLKSWCLFPLFYNFNEKYRLQAEIEAYKEQDKYNKNSKKDMYCQFIFNKYNINKSLEYIKNEWDKKGE